MIFLLGFPNLFLSSVSSQWLYFLVFSLGLFFKRKFGVEEGERRDEVLNSDGGDGIDLF